MPPNPFESAHTTSPEQRRPTGAFGRVNWRFNISSFRKAGSQRKANPFSLMLTVGLAEIAALAAAHAFDY